MSDSSLDTTDSPSIDMDNKHTLNLISNSTNSHFSSLNTPNIAATNLFAMNNFDDLLFNTPTTTTTHDNAVINQMDFLMMDFTQQNSASAQIGANIHVTSPVLDFQNTINITPSLNGIALTSGLLEMSSNPNTPHLPPLNIEDANPQQTDLYPTIPTIPTMPIVNGIGDNIPPPTHDLDWQTFCNLINNNNNNNNNMNHNYNNSNNSNSNNNNNNNNNNNINNNHDNNNNSNNSTDKKRKNNEILSPPQKKRKLNTTKKENIQMEAIAKPKKKKRGRPRKNPQKVNIKKEKKEKKMKKNKRNKTGSDDEYDMEEYLKNSYAAESFVGIRTEDGEVRIQIPPNAKTDDGDSTYNNNKVKFSVFGNACSDKIEDILQPKKRTRYVRGLSEEEKKTRRREQNRNAAARSRARKNAMISKVIQLHQENMGLRAFVAENITQTKILRDEINRLNAIIILNQQQQQPQQQQTQSSLFDIINQDSSTLFQSK